MRKHQLHNSEKMASKSDKIEVLLLYGWQGNSAEHWQEWLNKKLQEDGIIIHYPQLPNAHTPTRAAWMHALEDTMKNVHNIENLVVVTHSLGGALWLHYIARHPESISSENRPRKVILVAPPFTNPGIPEIDDFFPLPDAQSITTQINNTKTDYQIVGSDNDDYIPLDTFKQFAHKYNMPFTLLPNAGHINVRAGYGPWPWIYDQVTQV